MIDFKDEFLRLCSFPRFWSAEKSFLALRGFYYSGIDLQIICAFCEVNLNLHIIKVDETKDKHEDERCLRGKLEGNLSLGSVADYKYEKNRLCSFLMDKWPHPVDPNGLASTGFFWTGYYDMVRCAFCGLEVKDWELGDTGEDAHTSFNPDCPFLTGADVGNIPIQFQNADERIARQLVKEHTKEEARKLPNNGGEDCDQVSGSIALALKPVFPGFAAPVIRNKSFALWPKGLQPRPGELSDAGFFYTGKGDRVMCFQCGGGLMNWEETHSAWEEHALWFPTCSFLAIMKGKDFISQVHAAAIKAFENNEELLLDEGANNCDETEGKESQGVEALIALDDSSMMCRLCRESEIKAVTLPCGHMSTCPKCAPKLENCLMCGKVACSYLVTYLS